MDISLLKNNKKYKNIIIPFFVKVEYPFIILVWVGQQKYHSGKKLGTRAEPGPTRQTKSKYKRGWRGGDIRNFIFAEVEDFANVRLLLGPFVSFL